MLPFLSIIALSARLNHVAYMTGPFQLTKDFVMPIDGDFNDFSHDQGENGNKSDDSGDEHEDDEPTSTRPPAGTPPDKPLEPFRIKHRWPRGYWGGPNIFLRTALFSSSKSAPGECMPGYLASLGHTNIKARGPRLNQWDLDVFMAALEACQDGKTLDMAPRELLRSMCRGESSRDIDALKASCKRLHECYIDASIRYQTMLAKRSWCGRLFDTFECIGVPMSTGRTRERIRISLDPKLGWFVRDDYTWFNIHDRKLLRQHRLAAGLHAIYSTNATAYSYPLERLRDLLGVAARSGEFDRLLKAALGFLEEHKLVEDWRIAGRELSVTPKLTAAKISYLTRKGLPVPLMSKLVTAAVTQNPATNCGISHRLGTAFMRSVRDWLGRIAARARRIAPRVRG
jgi:hypothetical protein